MSPDPRLLVPATQELLDDWCGPVLVDGLPSIANLGEVLWRGPSQAEPRWWYWKNPDRVELDLRFAECRDRVARVLARTAGPVWFGRDADPSDDTRLPDGSRLVDALALAAVARDLLGSFR